MKTEAKTNVQVPIVQVNGKEVLDFTPQSTSQAAIVPLSVIQRLAKLLGTANIREIKEEMRDKLSYGHPADINTMEEYVSVLQEEINFHTTVNLLAMYEPQLEKESEYVQ